MAELKMTAKGSGGEPSKRAPRAAPAQQMVLKLPQLVSIKAVDVGMSDLAVGPSRNLGDGFTDGSISKGERFERELVAWTGGDDAIGGIEDGGGLLEDPTMKRSGGGRGGGRGGRGGGGWGGRGGGGGGGEWDQFAANKNMFGVDTGLCCSYKDKKVIEGSQMDGVLLCDDDNDFDTCRKVHMAWCNTTDDRERVHSKYKEPVVREMEVRCTSSACPLDAVCGINALGDEDGNVKGDFNPKRANMLGTSTGLCCDYETKTVKEGEMMDEWFMLAWCKTNHDDGLLSSYEHPYEGSSALRKRTRRSRTLLSEDADDEEAKEEEELERSGVEYAYSVIGKVAVDAAWPLDNNASISIAANALFKFPCEEGEFSSGSGTMTLDGVPKKVRNEDLNLVPVNYRVFPFLTRVLKNNSTFFRAYSELRASSINLFSLEMDMRRSIRKG